jgi:hypothetical protein
LKVLSKVLGRSLNGVSAVTKRSALHAAARDQEFGQAPLKFAEAIGTADVGDIEVLRGVRYE